MGRKVIIGVTGSIAAYKAAELLRLFVKNGDDVRVVMTPAACEFVRPLTFQTLSRNPVAVDQFAQPVEWKPGHISLAEWADLAIVAPAMNDGMWGAAATIENIEKLRARGILVMSPREGDLACGRRGLGRMPEPDEIFAELG